MFSVASRTIVYSYSKRVRVKHTILTVLLCASLHRWWWLPTRPPGCLPAGCCCCCYDILHTHTRVRASRARDIYCHLHTQWRVAAAAAAALVSQLMAIHVSDAGLCVWVNIHETQFLVREFFEETQCCVLTMNVSSIQVAAWPHRFYKKVQRVFYSGTETKKKSFFSLWNF